MKPCTNPISHQNFNLLIYFLHQHRFMNSYFIQWVIICYCHCLFECSPYPALASGSPFNLDYFFLACPCHFLSTSLISIRRSLFSHLYPEVSHSPGNSGSFSWKTIFGYQDLATLRWMPFQLVWALTPCSDGHAPSLYTTLQ